MYVNCPPVSSNGMPNQCTCFTERPSINGYTIMVQELGNWPINVQLGSTNSKGLPVLFQGAHQDLFLNNCRYLPMMPWLQSPHSHELGHVKGTSINQSIHPSIHPSSCMQFQIVVLSSSTLLRDTSSDCCIHLPKHPPIRSLPCPTSKPSIGLDIR